MSIKRMIIYTSFLTVLTLSSLYAQGVPHSINGRVINNDASVPAPGCIEFTLVFSGSSDTLTESSLGCGYEVNDSGGFWYANVSGANDGDTVTVYLHDVCENEEGQAMGVIDLTPPSQYFGLTSLVPGGYIIDRDQDKISSAVELSPNPFTTELRFNFASNVKGNIYFYNVYGICVDQLNIAGYDAVWQPDETISSGLYIVAIDISGEKIFTRVLLNKQDCEEFMVT